MTSNVGYHIDHRQVLRTFRSALFVTSCLALGSSIVYAQEGSGSSTSPAAQSSTDQPGDIVVTALRRDTRLQETPLAITAVTGESLAKAGTTSFTELTRDAPSLRIVDSGPGQRRVVMRGVRSAGEPTVGVYYDDTPVSGSVSTSSDAGGFTPDFRLFDVERVEALRGPQGTLFGSGSMGGTLRIIFEKPKTDRLESQFSGTLSAIDGGSQGGSADVMFNAPIIQDKIAVRMVGYYNKFAGFVDNIRYGDKNINDGRDFGGRLMLRMTPTDRLTIDGAIFYNNVDTVSPRSIAETGIKYSTDERVAAKNVDRSKLFSGTLKYDFDTVQLTAVTSYFDRDRFAISDQSELVAGRDNEAGCQTYRTKTRPCTSEEYSSYLANWTRFNTSGFFQPNHIKNWTNELRLSSTGSGPLNWTVGGFLENRKTHVQSITLAAQPGTGEFYSNVPENWLFMRRIKDILNQKALYAELSYEALDGVTLTGGTRYYKYTKDVGGQVVVGQEQLASTPSAYTERKASEDGFIFKGNISWQVNRDLLLYAQMAEGFRPGGVNQAVGLPAAIAPYSPDKLTNYELGLKSTLMPGMYFNLDGYYIQWDDLQVAARTTGAGSAFGLIANAGAARIYGLEAEFTARPVTGLDLSANLGYTNAKLSEDQVSEFAAATGRKGERLADVPELTAGASAEYSAPLDDDKEWSVRADASYVGASYSSISTSDIYRRRNPAYELVNLRATVQSSADDWSVSLFVNNLFDKYAITSISTSANTAGRTVIFSSPPRTFGLSLMRRFR